MTPPSDSRATESFRQHADLAERLGVTPCSAPEAMRRLAQAVRQAGDGVEDPALRALVAPLIGDRPPSFERLRRTLGVAAG